MTSLMPTRDAVSRLTFGFHSQNHAAALACALLPLRWGWRRCLWPGRLLSLALFLALLMTRSRTGLVVAVAEAATWWRLRKGRFRVSHLRSHKLAAAGIAALAVAALWWMCPRMALDGSVLDCPKIWLAAPRPGRSRSTTPPGASGRSARAGRDVLVPVRPVARCPAGLGLDGVGRVLLLGDCREWACLVPKGVPVTCAED